ncbi:MAG: hypothetical protein NZ839_04135, partial [Endomicrobia bacterium]|nr:hypothetical protein [Endomicrobiia bacterium]
MFKNFFLIFIFQILFFFSPFGYSDVNTDILSQKLKKIKYSNEEIQMILDQAKVFTKNRLPESLLLKLINEIVIKKVPFDKSYPVVKNYVSTSISAKILIERVKTSKFQPKDYEYCLSIVIEMINSGIMEEEYIKLMSLLSNTHTFDEATAILSYYIILKKYFSTPVIDKNNNKISTPYEVLFFKYYNRPVKELSSIIQNIVRYFTISKDVNEIFDLLFRSVHLPTKKIVRD